MTRMEIYRKNLAKQLYYSHVPGQTERHSKRVLSKSLPIVIHPYSDRYEVEVQRNRDVCFQTVRSCAPDLNGAFALDCYALRIAFQQVNSPEKLEQFLYVCGPFSERFSETRPGRQRISWPQFQQWQILMTAFQQNTVEVCSDIPDQIQSRFADLVIGRQIFKVSPGVRSTQLEAQPATALEVVAAVTCADLIAETPIRRCDGCANFYPVESKHDRGAGYCSPTCKHRHWQEINPKRKAVKKSATV